MELLRRSARREPGESVVAGIMHRATRNGQYVASCRKRYMRFGCAPGVVRIRGARRRLFRVKWLRRRRFPRTPRIKS